MYVLCQNKITRHTIGITFFVQEFRTCSEKNVKFQNENNIVHYFLFKLNYCQFTHFGKMYLV